MTDQEQPKDPAEVLKQHFSSIQDPAAKEPPRWVMSERNRLKLERLRQRVRQLRGGQ
jgi:hypothetical protein